jgi:hypothetical protein
MAGIKIATFLGKAPKRSPELLPNMAAQIAENCKLYSGDLIPYPQPVVVANTNRAGTLKTLYALRNPNDPNDLKWLSWTTEVDIAVASANLQDEQRFYYTGDGAPKVSNYELATAGVPPYPTNSYDLGLPIPPDSATLTTTAATFTTVTSVSRERDAGNTATIITATAHGLRTGNIITITGFPAGTSTVATFNAANIECTVVDATTFTYFSPGEIVATTADTDGEINLAGLTQARSYVFTWYTPWEEESIASKPSDDLFIKEGITVTVSNLPTAKPAGSNFVRGVRLYRTLPTISGTEYFRLSTLWFPTALTAVQRTANVSRVTLAFPHNLSIDDRFKISGCTVASFDITGGIVTDIIDDNTFEYAQVAANVAATSVGAGTLFHDVAELLTDPARYWGDGGNYDFIDDFDSRNLFNVLGSDEYEPPPDNLQGLVTHKNNILVGFVGNTLYFSEPALPHAWPVSYATPVGDDIVALASIAGALLVLTKGYPYVVSTNDPAAGISVERIGALYPCLNARSVVAMGYGIVWSTVDGLAVFSPNSGPTIITKALYNNDTWSVDLDPNSVIAEYYGENYFASHAQGSFVFEQDTQVGGFFVDTGPVFTASWYDTQTGALYYTTGTLGDVYQWDDLTQPALTMEWKSKVIVTKDMINLGAARVIADYSTVTTAWDSETRQWNAALTNWNNADEITFKLWVDKQLIFTTTVNDTDVFRLPSGYRTDTFEVGVEGNVRVRAIHIAETSLGLREV